MVILHKLIIGNRYLRYTPFWWWYRLMSHQGFRFDDYHIWTEFWYSINKGYVDTEYKWEFEKFWGKGAKPEPIYVSQEDYDKLQEMIAEPPELNPKLIELGEKWMLENDETLRKLAE
jgi:hypothetical protein